MPPTLAWSTTAGEDAYASEAGVGGAEIRPGGGWVDEVDVLDERIALQATSKQSDEHHNSDRLVKMEAHT